MTQELAGKVAVITGGAKGLGRGAVELFVAEGAQVVVADVDVAAGAALAETLGSAVRFRRADVSRREEVEALVAFAVAEFGGLQVMFNNAGVTDEATGRLLDDDFGAFERVMAVNVLGVMLGTQAAARHMARHGGGSIINTASIGGLASGYGFPVYRAAKAGVVSFTKSAAIELGEHLIRVNCICPGNIPTDLGTFQAPAPGMTAEAAARLQAAIGEIRMARQPLKRQGRPLDVAQAALFLASDRAEQITAQVLSVDGGATAGDVRSLIQEISEARAALAQG
ncbi:SDR family NAD(P)-dependent oxidoreductase [Phenylobacterium sp. LjRoot219]|uniref:SDR family NAD(P)-dependent oxidoreductase n=1 Tax=Phenylobacterium sp. LjRoot219 TaxID=3342283 RepID=UPI003ECE7D9F